MIRHIPAPSKVDQERVGWGKWLKIVGKFILDAIVDKVRGR